MICYRRYQITCPGLYYDRSGGNLASSGLSKANSKTQQLVAPQAASRPLGGGLGRQLKLPPPTCMRPSGTHVMGNHLTSALCSAPPLSDGCAHVARMCGPRPPVAGELCQNIDLPWRLAHVNAIIQWGIVLVYNASHLAGRPPWVCTDQMCPLCAVRSSQWPTC